MLSLSVHEAVREAESTATRVADLVHIQMETAGQLTDLSTAEIGDRSKQIRAQMAQLTTVTERFTVQIPEEVGCKGKSLHFGDFQALLQFAQDNGQDLLRVLGSISMLSGSRVDGLTIRSRKLKDVSALAACTQMRNLKLCYNQIPNISPLAQLTQLDTLEISGNKLTDISALSACKKLQWLNLGQNQLTDISAIESCPNLKFLDLKNNPLSQKARVYAEALREKIANVFL